MKAQPISILEQRRIEAGVIKPLVRAFETELGTEKTREVLTRVIAELARQKGREMGEQAEAPTLTAFAAMMEPWVRNGSLEYQVLEQNDQRYAFNVTRCQYAEMYRELGMEDLGCILSCNRDATLIEGFNPGLELQRSQTLMEGASFCDFRYRVRQEAD